MPTPAPLAPHSKQRAGSDNETEHDAGKEKRRRCCRHPRNAEDGKHWRRAAHGTNCGAGTEEMAILEGQIHASLDPGRWPIWTNGMGQHSDAAH